MNARSPSAGERVSKTKARFSESEFAVVFDFKGGLSLEKNGSSQLSPHCFSTRAT